MIRNLILICSLLGCITFSKAQDTLYFDQDWNVSNKTNYAFYRPIPLQKIGGLVFIRDYYKNGNLQMQGYTLSNNEDAYVGDIYYYNENGYDKSFRQFENISSTKELTYYHPDGSIWQKISYDKKGKKENIKTFLKHKLIAEASIDSLNNFSGTFSFAETESYYDKNIEQEKLIRQSAPIAYETMPIIGVPNETTTNLKPKKAYYITTFWENGQIATQKRMEDADYYGTEVKEQKYYDKKGNLLSTRPENKNTPFKTYEFYTKNHFATGITKMNTYVNGLRNGENITYDTTGQIIQEEVYEKGIRTQSKIYHAGKLIANNRYVDSKPFDGEFTISEYNFVQNFKLIDGIKTGEETTTFREDSTLIAKGLYKDGKSWNGTFFVYDEKSHPQIQSYRDGKLHGIQKTYVNNYLNEIIEEVEMINGKHEGFRKIYQNDTIIAESVYKDDIIISGTIIEGELTTTYKNGKIVNQKIILDSYSKYIKEEKFYNENESIQKIIYYDFKITENPQPKYEGIYKNKKPWQGYFRQDTLIDNIRLIDFYENGQLKYKYYFDFLEQLENYNFYTYTQKSTYKDGEIIDGKSFKLLDQSGLLEVSYQDSKPTKLDLNLFGMHYYARYSAEIQSNKLIISQYEVPQRIEIYKEGDLFLASYFKEDRLIQKNSPQMTTKEGSPHSLTFFYLKNNEIKKLTRPIQPYIEDEDIKNSGLNHVYQMFPISNKKDINQFFEEIVQAFQKSENLDGTFLNNFAEYAPFVENNFLGVIQYDESGKIPYGIRITPQQDNSILLEGYLNNVIKEKIKVKNLEDLLRRDKEILTTLSYRLLNEYN